MGAPSRFLYGLLMSADRHPAPNALKVALGSAALIGLAAFLGAGILSGGAFGRSAFGCGSFAHSGIYRRNTGLGHRISHRLHLRLLGAGRRDLGLRLGLALLQSGKNKAKAVQVLRSVQGNDGAADLGRLWALYANTQG